MVDSVAKANPSAARVVSNKSSGTVTESPGTISPPVSSTKPIPPDEYAGPSCASPALPDQRRCLLSYLARSDVTLDRNYQALITALKREAGTTAGGREPATVTRLRTAQRNWLVYRDDECRRRNEGTEGPLWAPTRARCLAEYSGQRSQELANALATRATTTADSSKPTSSKSSVSKSKSSKSSVSKKTKKTTKRTPAKRTNRRRG
jgi:uncharacterized protein YecT (DUF1311 family)